MAATARGAIVVNGLERAAGQRLGQLRRIGDGRRAADDLGRRFVEGAHPQQPAEDVRDMAAKDTAIVVQLVNDDVAQVLEEALPFRVMRQDTGVEHVRVADDDMPGQPHRSPGAAGRIAVVGERLDVHPQRLDETVQLAVLVLTERFGREEVERPAGVIVEDGLEHRHVVAERLPGRRCRHHDDIAAVQDRLNGRRLMGIRAADAAARQRRREPWIEARRPLGIRCLTRRLQAPGRQVIAKGGRLP